VTYYTVFKRIFYTHISCRSATILSDVERIISENIMTRRDNGKASLVEFLRSIKFAHQKPTVVDNACPTHFAHFNQHARVSSKDSTEENKHVRSAN
jgi:hypothetical protein